MSYRGGFSGLPICLAHVGPWAGFRRFERRSGWIGAQIEAGGRLCRSHGRDQRRDADDLHDAFEIVGQYVQGHFGADPFQRLHLEVGMAHPGFDGPERMLNGLAALAHFLRVLVEPSLDGLENMFMLPAFDPALFTGRAVLLYRTALAG